MNLAQLIQHPRYLDKESLYDLRSLLARYPYYQPARLLLLHNLYLLHDPSFDEELRRAALYITDRRVLFQLVEAAHYRLGNNKEATEKTTDENQTSSRTVSLINSFLDTIPEEPEKEQRAKRRPTPADATIDYVAYLLDIESSQEEKGVGEEPHSGSDKHSAITRTESLIDKFIRDDGGSFELKETPEYIPDLGTRKADEDTDTQEEYFTETLARIYIRQGRYSKALEIIKRLNLLDPKKNRYFADQIRFLEKLIINNNKK